MGPLLPGGGRVRRPLWLTQIPVLPSGRGQGQQNRPPHPPAHLPTRLPTGCKESLPSRPGGLSAASLEHGTARSAPGLVVPTVAPAAPLSLQPARERPGDEKMAALARPSGPLRWHPHVFRGHPGPPESACPSAHPLHTQPGSCPEPCPLYALGVLPRRATNTPTTTAPGVPPSVPGGEHRRLFLLIPLCHAFSFLSV